MMNSEVNVGVIGDFNPSSDVHRATNHALTHAADALGATVNVEWMPTPELESISVDTMLGRLHGLWCAPGSPYASILGALQGIRFARERTTAPPRHLTRARKPPFRAPSCETFAIVLGNDFQSGSRTCSNFSPEPSPTARGSIELGRSMNVETYGLLEPWSSSPQRARAGALSLSWRRRQHDRRLVPLPPSSDHAGPVDFAVALLPRSGSKTVRKVPCAFLLGGRGL